MGGSQTQGTPGRNNRKEFQEVAQQVMIGKLGKDPDLAKSVAWRVVIRTNGVRPAVQLAKLCGSREEVVLRTGLCGLAEAEFYYGS